MQDYYLQGKWGKDKTERTALAFYGFNGKVTFGQTCFLM